MGSCGDRRQYRNLTETAKRLFGYEQEEKRMILSAWHARVIKKLTCWYTGKYITGKDRGMLELKKGKHSDAADQKQGGKSGDF